MRRQIPITKAVFAKEGGESQLVNLPHTWNHLDGQDGGGDYWRGKGHYHLELPDPMEGKRQYIQFEGANHVAEVSCNGTVLGTHKGGFSTFRFELTDVMHKAGNVLDVTVSNEEGRVYPQSADFTFYGGLYRDVTYIEVEEAHFDLQKNGTSGVFVTPHVSGNVHVDAFLVNVQGCSVACILRAQDGTVVASAENLAQEHMVFQLEVQNPHLWNGRPDPYCYMAELTLKREGQAVDTVTEQFGFRSFHVDPERGFFLNGRSYPLRGVSRHQDREDMGWAISRREHEEDIALIKEIGATTIRLAHYQHAGYFYDLCDQEGFVVWAEIPFITMFMEGKEAHDNTISQMTELVAQNYNHPSICFWGISNEISVAGESQELYENLCELHALVKKMDPLRLTTMAQVSMLPQNSEHNDITDVLSYNHYFGWYMGDISENGTWLDEFHRMYPDRAIGLSEYGAEAVVSWHSAEPVCHDYTEEYQAYYHQRMLELFEERPYLWATHVWNMFDFAADSRDEGGCKGRNNKGLVTYDRKTKKDAFYLYKAYWTKEPMVHICGARFTDRAPGERNVTVYTNCPSVTLEVNGREIAKKEARRHVVIFEDVPLAVGENQVSAKAGESAVCTITLRGTAEPNGAYVLPDDGAADAGNWFDGIVDGAKLEFREGYFSIRDKICDLMGHPETAVVMDELFDKMFPEGQDMEKSIKLMKNMALEPILTISKVPKGTDVYLNNKLNKIRK